MKRRFGFVLVAVAVAGCSGDTAKPQADSDRDRAVAALKSGDLELARSAATRVARSDPGWADSQFILGQAELAAGSNLRALEHFRRVPRDGSEISIRAALAAASAEESTGRLSAAIGSYEYVLEHVPEQTAAMGRVSELYALTGQRWKAETYLQQLAKTPDLSFRQLVLLTDFERRSVNDLRLLEELERKSPDDSAVQLGLAVEDFHRGQMESARRHVEAALATDPDLAAAHALRGEILLLRGDNDELMEWHRRLPASVQNDPGIWYVRGRWAEQLDEHAVAARCFWESARRTPTAYRAVHQLGRVLSEIDPATGQKFARWGEDLHRLQRQLSSVLDSHGADQVALKSMVELLLDSGREWEAWSWAVMAQSRNPQSLWVRQVLERLPDYPNSSSPRILESADPFKRLDLSHYPEFADVEFRLDASKQSSTTASAVIRFEDDAAVLGLDFTYHRGRTSEIKGVRMQESTGGGVGVLDYDNDGRPDLMLTQGEDWSAGANEPTGSARFRDMLYRNAGDCYQNATVFAGLPEEDGFGQGCACGDYNSDGFQDIYIANIGRNQLLINNGDGTFFDATSLAGFAANSWTTSCLIADLNSDGHTELFDVNYVQGPLLFQKICDENECSPEEYSGAPDCVHVSLGDGSLRSMELKPGGRVGAGLGVVAFRPDGSPSAGEAKRPDVPQSGPVSDEARFGTSNGRLSLFIANDQDPNFFLRSTPSDDPLDLAFVDDSFVVGLALNRDGRTTACMGVASGDVTGDGRLDLFVTNYKDESNTFYVQGEGGLFTDSVGGSKLLLAGLPYVGWGTQFLDVENDGRLDIVVANGHVGMFDKPGVPYRMPTQIFRNQGNGQFEELSPDRVGGFFNREIFGRSMATLDWNRDGLTDFVLSSLDENVALLTNQSTETGHWVAFRLHGTSSSRDAIGATVTVTTESQQIRRQLTAGDGYQATNERILRFGLDRHDSVRQVLIEWPSGQTQSHASLPVAAVLSVIEGGTCMPLP